MNWATCGDFQGIFITILVCSRKHASASCAMFPVKRLFRVTAREFGVPLVQVLAVAAVEPQAY